MRNTLGDLNNHLFAQLERLTDEDLTNEQLEKEIRRSKGVTSLASQIISGGHLVLRAKQAAEESLDADAKLPRMLEG